jgi:hypothetical protein
MFSRAKRVQGQKGRRIEEQEWVVEKKDEKKGSGEKIKETVRIVDSLEDEDEELLAQLMDEAVERGYGSDCDAKS